MSIKNNSFLLILLGTIVALVGGIYLLAGRKENKLHFEEEEDGFKTDAQNLQKDFQT